MKASIAFLVNSFAGANADMEEPSSNVEGEAFATSNVRLFAI